MCFSLKTSHKDNKFRLIWQMHWHCGENTDAVTISSMSEVMASQGSGASHHRAKSLNSDANTGSTTCRHERASETKVWHPSIQAIIDFAPWFGVTITAVLGVDPPPDYGVQRRWIVTCYSFSILRNFAHWALSHNLSFGHVQELCGPSFQMIEDVSTVEDGGATHFTL